MKVLINGQVMKKDTFTSPKNGKTYLTLHVYDGDRIVPVGVTGKIYNEKKVGDTVELQTDIFIKGQFNCYIKE